MSKPPPQANGWRATPTGVYAWFPPLRWLSGYSMRSLGFDALAGITLAAYSIPISIAYASLAGLPPQSGLYCYLFGGLGYALLGGSRHLAVGPTSAISLIFGASLAHLAPKSPQELAGIATMVTLMVALVFVLAWFLRLSVAVNFISDSILVGFKAGAAVAIASTQLPKLFGLTGGGENLWERLARFVAQIGNTNPYALSIGITAILLLTLGRRFFPGRPVALGVVLLSIWAVAAFGLATRGVRTVGTIAAGVPCLDLTRLRMEGVDLATFRDLIRLAFACFVLSYVESISAARAFALKHREDLDPRQELLGLGAASLLAGLFQGYPTAGGLSQTAVKEKAGARTQMSLVFTSLVLAMVLTFFTGFIGNLPDAVLGAVVLVAVAGLVDVGELRHLHRVSRMDFYGAMVALVGVLILGILDGVILAILASLLMLLVRSANPYVAFLGRIPGTDRFSDVARHPDNERIPEVVAFRVEASLVYFNVEHVFREVLGYIRAQNPPIRLAVCDLSNSPYVDVAGARMLARLHDELELAGITLRIVEAHGNQRDLLRAEGLENLVGPIDRHIQLGDLLGGKHSPP